MKNNKIKFMISLSLLVVVIVATGLYLTIDKANKYKITAELKVNTRELIANEKFTYKNETGSDLRELYFYLYPNSIYGSTSPGGNHMNVTNAASGEEKLKYEITGSDKSILKVTLPSILKDKEKFSLELFFNIKLDNAMLDSSERISYDDNSFNVGYWYPVLATYRDDKWVLDKNYMIGDPLCSAVADYDVSITLPKIYVVAATGKNSEESINGDKKTWVFKEKNVRDFEWSANKSFKIKEEIYNGVNIKCYYFNEFDEKSELALNAAKKSIDIFNESYGKYPYKTFSIVASSYPTSLAYTGLALINRNYFLEGENSVDRLRKKKNTLERAVVDAVAHQWWYSVIGNDSINEAWLDEGFSAFSQSVYYEKSNRSSEDNSYFLNPDEYKDNTITGVLTSIKQEILKPVYKFDGVIEYNFLMRTKAAALLNALKNKVGDDTFYEIFRKYYKKYKYTIASTKDFVSVVEDVTEKKWEYFFEKWLSDKDAYVSAKEKGKAIPSDYVQTVFGSWYRNAEADKFFRKNEGCYVKWTAHITNINSSDFLVLQEKRLPEIWAKFDYDVVKNNKLKEGDVVTLSGVLSHYYPSVGILADSAQWYLTDCKMEKTNKEDIARINSYLQTVSKEN